MIPCHPALRSPLRVVKIWLSQVVNFRLSLLTIYTHLTQKVMDNLTGSLNHLMDDL